MLLLAGASNFKEYLMKHEYLPCRIKVTGPRHDCDVCGDYWAELDGHICPKSKRGGTAPRELRQIASMLEWLAEQAVKTRNPNVQLDANALVPNLVKVIRVEADRLESAWKGAMEERDFWQKKYGDLKNDLKKLIPSSEEEH